jgi:hypothetical protein
MAQLNAVGIVASDMARLIAFYRTLGLDVPDTPGEGHVEASVPSLARGEVCEHRRGYCP